jgi:hypothetical protein
MWKYWGIGLLIAGTVSCQKQQTTDQVTATVTGRVTYQDRVVTSGRVMVLAAEGSYHHTLLNADGTYRLENVPIGPARFGLDCPPPEKLAKLQGETRRRFKKLPGGDGWLVPPRYLDLENSQLLRDVNAPATVYDIDIREN